MALSTTKSSVSKADIERINMFSKEFGESGAYNPDVEAEPEQNPSHDQPKADSSASAGMLVRRIHLLQRSRIRGHLRVDQNLEKLPSK